MPRWSPPTLPKGPLRDLNRHLHALHKSAGYPSSRDLAKEIRLSYTSIHSAFTKPVLPSWGALELIVEELATRALPRRAKETEKHRFKGLWDAADTEMDPSGLDAAQYRSPERGAVAVVSLLHDVTNGGDPEEMTLLAEVFKKRGDVAQAERLFRAAAEGGNVDAAAHLGILLKKRGQQDDARYWLHKAAASGHLEAVNSFAVLLQEEGQLEDAEQLYLSAIDQGHTGAMNNYAVLLKERGQPELAEQWYRRAAKAGQPEARRNLTILFIKHNQFNRASEWWREAM